MQHDGIKGIIESGQAPGVMGLKKGPNMSIMGKKEFCFERPDAAAEFRRDLSIMENTRPMSAKEKKMHMRTLKRLELRKQIGDQKPIDYGNVGHELER